MASVDGKTSLKIDQLINDTIISGQVVNGHLILESRGGAQIDAGIVSGSGGGIVIEEGEDDDLINGAIINNELILYTRSGTTINAGPVNNGSGGSTTNVFVNSPFMTVASSTLPTDIKDACMYQCDGVNDQVQINNALERASRINDGFPTAEGFAIVVLVGDKFVLGNPITMYPSTKLMGGGDGTLIESAYPNGDTRGLIELKNVRVARCTVSDLSIGSPDGNPFNGSGILFDMTNDLAGYDYDFPTGGDAFVKIRRVSIYNPNQKGIWLIDGREAQIDNIHIQNSRKQGLFIDGHTDVKITRVVANGNAGTEAGIEITGGNGQITDSKVFYRGNKDDGVNPTGTPQHGFKINASRVTIGDCQAQDNGGYGFHLQGSDLSVSNCMADSNSAQDSTYGGFFIAASGSYTGLVACHRPNNFINQNRGIVFSGSPQVSLSARVSVESGINHVVGSPGGSSHVRVVRSGNAVYSVGTDSSISALDLMPVGFVYTSVVATNPSTLFGGTWARIGQGRVLVGQDGTQTEFDTAEETGGEKTHTITSGELPSHTHSIDHDHPVATSAVGGAHAHTLERKSGAGTSTGVVRGNGTASAAGTTDAITEHTHDVNIPNLAGTSGATGSGTPANNLQPYLVVYMWKRTA